MKANKNRIGNRKPATASIVSNCGNELDCVQYLCNEVIVLLLKRLGRAFVCDFTHPMTNVSLQFYKTLINIDVIFLEIMGI
jgi:hypothetical protein